MGPNCCLDVPIVDKIDIKGYDDEDEDYKNLDDQFWMYPEDARKYKLTYFLDLCIYINIELHYQNNEGKHIQNQINFSFPNRLGGIPLMVRASNCALNTMDMFNYYANDIGGYFIIDGVEKVLPMELPGELMQQHMKEWYIEQTQSVVSRIALLFHNNNYTGENFPKLFKENYNDIFDFQDGLEISFRKLFT
jgi:DNA-directed RNA polymerase beta subunit